MRQFELETELVMNRLVRAIVFARGAFNHASVCFFFTINLTLAGCTIGNYGTLVAKYTRTETATVVDVYSLGFQIRPERPDFGGTLGYRRSSYIFSSGRDALSNSDGSYWRWFSGPWPSSELVARGSTSLGIEVQATAEVSRLSIGYVDQLITVGPAADESKVVKLYYNRRRPEETNLFVMLLEGESSR